MARLRRRLARQAGLGRGPGFGRDSQRQRGRRTGYNSDATGTGGICGLTGADYCNYEHNQIGWGVDAGVKINLPSFGAGDDALLTGSYTQSAVWYSGLPDMMWGENGQVNGNGQPMYMQDAYFNPLTNQWSKPTAWSVSALIEHHFTPQFYLDLEGSVGQLKWSNQNGGCSLIRLGWLRHCVIRGTRRDFAQRDDLAGRRGSRLEPGHQPQLRPGVDVSEHEPERAEPASLGRSTTGARRTCSSCRATGMGSATVSRAASASPATSDRLTIS